MKPVDVRAGLLKHKASFPYVTFSSSMIGGLTDTGGLHIGTASASLLIHGGPSPNRALACDVWAPDWSLQAEAHAWPCPNHMPPQVYESRAGGRRSEMQFNSSHFIAMRFGANEVTTLGISGNVCV